MPRSRSISIVSSTCSRISRASSPPQVWISRSASVDLPWSICAMIAKLRIWLIGVVMTFQRVPLIGFVHGSAPVGQYKSYVASFVAGLREEDFESGRNVAVEYRWAEGEYERVPGLTTDLLSLKPSLIVAYGPPNLLRAALDAASRDVPIVFGTGGDPVAAGIVASLARPGGYATGVANRTNTLDIKRLELLRDLVPQATTIGMILNPKSSDAEEVTKAAQEVAKTLD